MAVHRLVEQRSAGIARSLFARVGGLGIAGHPHATMLADGVGPDAARNLADAVHLLCNLHGRHPGLLDHAYLLAAEEEAREWLRLAAQAFDRERAYLVRLSAASGPIPSTPGAAQSEAALTAQRNALDTLARSERNGCGLGASGMLVLQWYDIRPLLDRAARRIGIESPPVVLPGEESVAAILDSVGGNAACERAIGFGAEQLLLQHRALFDLLETRASARCDY